MECYYQILQDKIKIEGEKVKKIKNFIIYLVLGFICLVACIFSVRYELQQQGSRYRLTVGTAALTILFFVAAFTSFSKKNERNAVMIIEDVFSMNSGGCVVVGVVQGGFMIHDKVEVMTSNGETIKSKIYSMEIQNRKVNIAKDCKVAIYLKDIEPSKLHTQDKVVYKD